MDPEKDRETGLGWDQGWGLRSARETGPATDLAKGRAWGLARDLG